MDRAEVERGILDEEIDIEEIAGLLERQTPLAAWPVALREALGLALDDPRVSRSESWKIIALRRHLFGVDGHCVEAIAPPNQPTVIDQRRAERARDGLTSRLRYRSGSYLCRR